MDVRVLSFFVATTWLVVISPTQAELETAFYIWQFDWTDAVHEAARELDGPDRSFMVLTSEWLIDDTNQLQGRNPSIDWSLFSDMSAGQIVPVLRMNASLTPWLEGRGEALAEAIQEHEARVRGIASAHGVTLGPLQIDYDCPTARLPAYRRLLRAYRAGGSPVTVTALPTWLSNHQFEPLAHETTGYVLQLHSLEPPRSPEEPGTIFSREPQSHIERASRIGVPFHIALPTYGYAYTFDSSGAFQHLRAEDAESPWRPRADRRVLMADPVRVAAAVREVTAFSPPHCRGIAWFRMPVAGDELNWHRATLEAVMNGDAPVLDVRAELKAVEGRWECWLANHGTADPWGQLVQFDVGWTTGYPLAMEALGEYSVVRRGRDARWTGPAPRVGSPPCLAGWLRFSQAGPAVDPSITPVQLAGMGDALP